MGYSFKPIRRGPRQVWQHPKRFVVWCGIDYSSLYQGDFGPGAIMHAFALPDEVLKKGLPGECVKVSSGKLNGSQTATAHQTAVSPIKRRGRKGFRKGCKERACLRVPLR